MVYLQLFYIANNDIEDKLIERLGSYYYEVNSFFCGLCSSKTNRGEYYMSFYFIYSVIDLLFHRGWYYVYLPT